MASTEWHRPNFAPTSSSVIYALRQGTTLAYLTSYNQGKILISYHQFQRQITDISRSRRNASDFAREEKGDSSVSVCDTYLLLSDIFSKFLGQNVKATVSDL